jgi:hypothetical protein
MLEAAVNQPTRTSAPPSTGNATPVMKLMPIQTPVEITKASLGAEIVPPLHSAIMRYQEPTRRTTL